MIHAPAEMMSGEFEAMGTRVTVFLPPRQWRDGFEEARALFRDWESRLSRFLPDSELARVNRNPDRPLSVSPIFFRVLTTALRAAAATGGIFDPTLARHLETLGYDRSWQDMPSEVPASHAPLRRPEGRWRDVRVDPAKSTVVVPHGIALDFGGIGKGMAVDATISRWQEIGLGPGLINAGGDLAVLGTYSQGLPWPVGVPGFPATLGLWKGGLATSGTLRRRWRQGPALRHHLLDPRTGLPSTTPWLSVTVAAPTVSQAEVAAKVAFILGMSEGLEFLRRHRLSAWIRPQNGPPVSVGDWPASCPR